MCEVFVGNLQVINRETALDFKLQIWPIDVGLTSESWEVIMQDKSTNTKDSLTKSEKILATFVHK